MRRSLLLLIMFAAGTGGCGKSGSGPEAVKAPARSGDVWEIDRAAGRAAMPGAVLAYGARAIKLAGGLEALLVPAGEEKIDLRFSSGESIPLLKKRPKQK